jgi:hypothetical protein
MMGKTSAAVAPRAKRWKGLALVLAVFSAMVVGTTPAMATSVDLGETTGYGETYFWDTPRYISRTDSRANFTLTYHQPGTGEAFVVGLRNNEGYQWARAQSSGEQVSFVNTSGGLGMRSGTFRLNTKVQGRCGGDGCGLITWKFTLRYNL